MLVEAGYGFVSNSTALLADAGHNLSDVLGLVVAWIAAVLSKRPPTPRLTYGLRNTSILAALLNAVLLLIAAGAIILEAIQRLLHPEPVASMTVIVVAAVGIVINGVTAWLFASGRHGDLNIRGAYLHMAADAAVSAGVVVAGILIMLTGWLWVDPVTSLLIVAVIVWGTWGLLRESTAMSLAAVPSAIDPATVRGLSRRLARRGLDPRPAHLADEHHRDRADRPSGDASRKPRRRLPDRNLPPLEPRLQNRPRHAADRERHHRSLRAGARSCGVTAARHR